MLKKLVIRNFKPFSRFDIDFEGFTLLVGLNNMGKSTIIDILRLISLELNYRLRRDFVTIPADLFDRGVKGYRIDPEHIPFPVANVHHNYAAEPSFITTEFSDGLEVRLAFSADRSPTCYLAVFHRQGLIDSAEAIRRLLQGRHMAVLPPVAPLEESEALLKKRYVSETFGTRLSPRHFRNVWYHDPENFEDFRRLVSSTWPGIEIERPEINEIDNTVRMYYREHRLTRELAWSGQGMQAWLQILTYVCKMKDYDTIVLDEPEVFLHSDVQRKLVQLLRERAPQVIITTHSVDIINEVSLDDIAVVDKTRYSDRRLQSVRSLQNVLTKLGTVQNAHLLRAFRAHLTLLVEGQDKRLLSILFGKLGYGAIFDSQGLSVLPIGGISNIHRLGDIKWISETLVGERILTFAILDRDYSDDEEVQQLQTALHSRGIQSHIWERKEIENYALDPVAIEVTIRDGLKATRLASEVLSKNLVEQRLMESSDSCKPDVEAQLLKRALVVARKSRIDDSTTIKQFGKEFNDLWSHREYRLSRAPGADVISRLSAWSQSSFGVSLTAERIMEHLSSDSIAPEVKRLVMTLVKLSRQ